MGRRAHPCRGVWTAGFACRPNSAVLDQWNWQGRRRAGLDLGAGFFPFGSYFIGYIAGAFLAACLNLAMQLSGGLEIEVVQQPDAPSGVEPGPPAALPGDDGSSNTTAPPA